MTEKDIVESIFGWIGLGISTYFYLSPGVPYSKVMKGEMDHKDSPKLTLLCNLLNCILWIDYGLIKDSLQLYLTCSIGGFITLIWSTIYLIFLAKKNFFIGLGLIILLLSITLGLIYLFYFIFDIEFSGYVALIFNLLMYIAPGEKIYTVFKTGKYQLIPIFSTIGTLLCSGCWFIYGLYQSDMNLIIPNGLGLAFGLLQLLVYCIYSKKSKNKKIVEDDGNDVV